MLYKYRINVTVSIIIILALAIVFSVMRAMGTLGPSSFRWMLPLSFCIMAILPLILLTKNGRNEIGLLKPFKNSHYFLGIAIGVAAAFFCFLSGVTIFGKGVENWFVNIGNSYKSIMDTTGMSFLTLNLIFTIPAIIFSPIGEEIFFRGILQKTLEQKHSVITSTIAECILFSLVHLCHHGIIKISTGLVFLPLSASLWVIQMFCVAFMFSWLRLKTGSIYVSIASHAAFNITMNFLIFIFLWS